MRASMTHEELEKRSAADESTRRERIASVDD